jgi:methyl-accepting chemotaxis protein
MVAILLSAISIYQSVQNADESIDQLRKNLLADYDNLIKSEVETVVSAVRAIYEREQKGELKTDQAKELAAHLIRSMKYSKEGYFWADTVEGVNVVLLGKKDVEGKSRIDLIDKKGTPFIRLIIENGRKEGGGFTDYWFPKAGKDVAELKRGYSLEFKPWGWVIGTGNYVDDIEAIIKKEEDKKRTALKQEIAILVGAALLVTILAVIVAMMVFKKTLAQLGADPADLATIAARIADGDLSVSFETGKKLTGVYAQIQRMADKLKGMVGEIKTASASVASGSEQLSASAEEIGRTMTEQSNRCSQIATSAEEMSQTVVDIAKNAANIATSASDTASVARQGAQVVEKSVSETRAIADTVTASASVMKTLGERSQAIGEIVAVINDIADQTNLLALNAAIEAARAGEQGRGFAVVADEVRKLAERTAKATSEISDMIHSIQKEVDVAVRSMESTNEKVEVGLQYSVEAGEQLSRIVQSVTGLQSMVQQIASATEEMSATSEMISGDIQGVADGAREISQGSEQISKASSELARLSGQLKVIVDYFRL